MNLSYKLSMTKEVFLRYNKNKDRFIHLLGNELAADECKVLNADSDAYTLIVRTAIEQSNNEKTFIVGNDTDLLILVLKMYLSDSTGCYFKTEKNIWDLNSTKAKLGNLSDTLLFIHS